MPPEPPTIGYLKSQGLAGLFVTCGNVGCQRSAAFTFAELGLADDLPFPAIAVESGCGF